LDLDPAKLEDAIRELGLTDEEIAARKAFLAFGDEDVARLRALHPQLERARAEIINEFYAHLLSFEETSALLGDEETLMRLKRKQSAYLERLTAGEYDARYVRERLGVGIVHNSIGLEPKWYLSGYNAYLGLLFTRLWEVRGGTDRSTLEAMLALLKLVFLDIGLVTDTYIRERQKTIARKTSQLVALSQVMAAVTSSLSLRQVLEEVMQRAVELTGSRASCVALYDAAEGRFKDWVTRGLSEHFVRNMAFRPGGLADEAFSSGAYILSNDLPGMRHRLSNLARGEGIRSFICLPLRFQAQKVGVLYVYRDDRDDFCRDELELLTTFAHCACGAISNARLYAQMTDLARTDPLTGIANRRSFDERLGIEITRGERYRRPFAVLVVDLDHFKRVNDTYGHQAGDEALRRLAAVLRDRGRAGIDVAARLGGEEFAVLLPETATDGARDMAERIRTEVERSTIRPENGVAFGVTVSVGAACYPDHADSAAALMRAADQALYAAKRLGRNRTVVFGEPMDAGA
jgi:diguanylate cyclase (GGDEF)-like protein